MIWTIIELFYRLFQLYCLVIMGSGDSAIYNAQGEEVTNRKCIILVTPPSYETSKFHLF